MKRFKYVLFDLDGTVTDSYQAVIGSVLYAMEKLGMQESDPAKLRRFLGPPLVDSFQQFYGLSYEKAALGRDYYREHYTAGNMFHVTIYPGIPELLKDLREAGIKTGLATSKPEPMAEEILRRYDLYGLFDVVTGAGVEDHVRHSKTDVILEAMTRLGISEEDRSSTAMVGDRMYDIDGAHNCGLVAIGTYEGYAPIGELEEHGAEYVVNDVRGLREVLLEDI